MTKKILIITICIVTVCAVLGLNDRLNYEGLQYASELPKASANQILIDVESVRLLLGMIKVYDPTKDQSALGWSINPTGDEYKYTFWIGEEGFQTDPSFYAESIIFTDVDPTLIISQGIWDTARRFTHKPQNEILGWVILIAKYIPAALAALVNILTDILGVAFSCIRALFYLIGF